MQLIRRGRTPGLSLIFPVLLAGLLLFLAIRDVPWDETVQTIRQARLEYVFLSCLTGSLSFFIRGLRWRILLSAEKSIAPGRVFWATMVGYLGNSFLPARAGELLRTAMIGRVAGLSKSFVLATALTERLLDVVALVLISLLAIATIEALPELLLTIARVAMMVGLLGLAGLIMAPRIEKLLTKGLSCLPLPQKLRASLVSVLASFLGGMRAFQNPGRGFGFTALTLVIWLIDSAGTILLAQALGLSLTLPQALIFLAALGLSSAVPSTPGYVGVYQFVAVTVLRPFGFSQSEALAYIIVLQAGNYGMVTLWGLLGLWRLVVRNQKSLALP